METISKRTIVLDGAMGTMLMAQGLSAADIPEQWNISRPDIIRGIHEKYFESGSDAVTTNTFGANPIKLHDSSLDHEMSNMNRLAVRAAREACPEKGFVLGGMGPTGKIPAPVGTVSTEQMREAFLDQALALVESEVDGIIIETMFSLDEALAALRAARKAAGSLPVIVSLTYNMTQRGYFTIMGDEAGQSSKALAEAGADAVGANCTLGSNEMIGLAACVRAATDLPVIIQPNAGSPRVKDGVTFYEQTPNSFAADLQRIEASGASISGGCCGTTPEFIRAFYNQYGCISTPPGKRA